MEQLAKKICDRLQDHKSATIFENDIERFWPVAGKALQLLDQRKALIHAFAAAHGWSATIHDPGLRVTFRKLEPSQKEAASPKWAKAS